MNPKISVIVPVYNAEKYLHRCVDSILAQTYTDFELLLINDGSPDNCGAICDEYAQKDSRVRVFHKENGGVSSARNMGLDNAKGEWVTFVDADDWITSQCIEMLTQRLDADMIKCGIESFDKSSSWTVGDGLYGVKQFLDNFEKEFIARSSCVTLFKRELIRRHNVSFDKHIRFGEDMIFNLSYLIHCKSVRLVDFIGYIYFSEIKGTAYSMKYNLSLEDIEVSLRTVLNLRMKLKEKTGANVDLYNDFYLYFSMVPIIHLVEDEKLSEYFLLSKKFFPSLTVKEFYETSYISPIVRGIELLKTYYEQRLYYLAKELYEALCQISLNIVPVPNFNHKDFYVWFWLIKKKQFLLLDSLMKFYFFCKRKVRGK